MLFTKPFKERIRRGEQTLTFRRWKRPQAKPGGLYKLPPQGAIRVASVEVVETSAITDADARLAGHADRAETLAALGSGDWAIYRIAFAYVPPEQVPAPSHPPAGEIVRRACVPQTVAQSALGPWPRSLSSPTTRNAAPQTSPPPSASRPRLSRPTCAGLKALGLTESRHMEVGYRVTARAPPAPKPRCPSRRPRRASGDSIRSLAACRTSPSRRSPTG